MADDAREKWFAHMLQVGLEEKVVTPALMMGHVTPELLAHHLPPEELGKVLASALAEGTMNAEGLLKTLTAKTLVEHMPLDVIWACVEAGAERTGIGSGSDK